MNLDEYETGIPLTPNETLDRLGVLETAKEAHESELAGLKAETSSVKDKIEAIGEKESMLIRARRDGRTLFAMRDGGFSFEGPKAVEPTLPFDRAPAASGDGTPAGKLLDSPFAAKTFTAWRTMPDGAGREAAELRQEPDGKWWARCGGRPYALGLETREAAQAELEKDVGPLEWTAVVEAAAPRARGPHAPTCYRATYKGRRLSVTLETPKGGNVEGWRPRCATGDEVENAPEEWTGGEDGRSIAMQRCLDMAGFDSADPRPEWTPDEPPPRADVAVETMPPAPFPEKDEGAVYGADLPNGGKASVGQPASGAPWSAWLGSARVGELNGYPTSSGARAAVEGAAGVPLGSLAWRFELTPDEAESPAPPPPADSPAPAPTPAP